MKALTILFLVLAPGLAQAANTATVTPTMSPTSTVTLTATPGDGNYSLAPSTFVNGSSGNSMNITYQDTVTDFPSTGGLLTLSFPIGLDAPSSSNFYVQPSQKANVASSGYAFSGHTVRVKVVNLEAGTPLVLQYGANANGFAVKLTYTVQPIAYDIDLYAYPQSVTLGTGGLMAVPKGIMVVTPTTTLTVTPSFTRSPTFTVSPTFSITPTSTETPNWTATVTPTDTPVGKLETGKIYSYPNPFDLAKFDKCTFRFDPWPNVQVTVFNLIGEPVRELPASDIEGTKGFAIWNGNDESGHGVAGGLYFFRIKGKTTLVKKFTVLH